MFFVEVLKFDEGTFTAELDRYGLLYFRFESGHGAKVYSKNYIFFGGRTI